jgi:hypothetical protein
MQRSPPPSDLGLSTVAHIIYSIVKEHERMHWIAPITCANKLQQVYPYQPRLE